MYNTINKVMRLATIFVVLVCIQSTNHVLAQSATIHKIWIEHGVSYNGEKGMKVHAKVSVSGLKGKNIRMIAFFHDSSKKYLKGGISGYRATDGTPCVSEDTKPSYDNSSWEDYWLFIPYRALPLAAGKNTYYASFHVKDVSSGKYINEGFVYESFTGTGSGNNSAQQQVAQNRQQSLNYMDIHQKYSHSKHISGIGSLLGSAKDGDIYKYAYSGGWIETVVLSRCTSCFGQGSVRCPICYGQGGSMKYDFVIGISYMQPCSYCQATGRNTCMVCNGDGNTSLVTLINYKEKLMYVSVNGMMGNVKSFENQASYGGNYNSSGGNYNSGNSGSGSKDYDRCGVCGGSGKCGFCAGRGECRSSFDGSLVDCAVCNGSGRCSLCKGRGQL